MIISRQSRGNHAAITRQSRLTFDDRSQDAQATPALQLLEQPQGVLVRQLERVAVHLTQQEHLKIDLTQSAVHLTQ